MMGLEGHIVHIGDMKNAYKWRNWKTKFIKQLKDLGSRKETCIIYNNT
jgi:hypothetical protein